MQERPKSPRNAPKVIVMNDTSGRSHHGCSRVMRQLYAGLGARGLEVIARSPARHDWQSDRALTEAFGRADLVVINGEGTIHHGRPAGERLLQVAELPAAPGRKLALVNALYQDNPADWARYLKGFSLISTRDGRSADEIRAVWPDAPLRIVPDLSLAAGAEAVGLERQGAVFGDSVRLKTRQALALAAARCRARAVLPIKTRTGGIWHNPLARHLLYWVYNGVSPRPHPPFLLAADEAEYMRLIGGTAIHVSGRFHAICLSLVTGTPFLAVASNSWKIEALLAEAGIDRTRLLTPDQLAGLSANDLDRPFSNAESKAIAVFLSDCRAKAENLFDDLAELARGERS